MLELLISQLIPQVPHQKIEPRPPIIVEHTGEQKTFASREEVEAYVKEHGGMIVQGLNGKWIVTHIPKETK